jgi:hypothetical protein
MTRTLRVFRIALTAALPATLALAACGPSRDEELEKQLAEAKATAAQDAAALKAQREAAAHGGEDEQSLADFYAGGSGEDADAAKDEPRDDTADDAADEGTDDSPAAPPAPPPPPIGSQSDDQQVPVGPPDPVPQ